MKKLFVMAIAAIMSIGASAQLISSNTVTHKKVKGNGYNRLSVSYSSLSFDKNFNYDGFDAFDGVSGLSLAWTKGISISQTAPLFIETGIGATYAWASDKASEYDEGYTYTHEINHNFLNLTVPVNLVYKYEIPNSGVTLAPYVGIYLRGNILAKSEDEWSLTGTRYDQHGSDELNWFNDIDDEDWGLGASRFNIGWNIGIGAEWNKLYVGLSYGGDFNNFVDLDDDGYNFATKTNTFSATVGFNF